MNEIPIKIRELTSDFIFCSKCGAKNKFELKQENIEIIYLCWECRTELNEFWDQHFEGKLSIRNCSYCQEPTFKKFKHCISCGSKKGRVPEEERETRE